MSLLYKRNRGWALLACPRENPQSTSRSLPPSSYQQPLNPGGPKREPNRKAAKPNPPLQEHGLRFGRFLGAASEEPTRPPATGRSSAPLPAGTDRPVAKRPSCCKATAALVASLRHRPADQRTDNYKQALASVKKPPSTRTDRHRNGACQCNNQPCTRTAPQKLQQRSRAGRRAQRWPCLLRRLRHLRPGHLQRMSCRSAPRRGVSFNIIAFCVVMPAYASRRKAGCPSSQIRRQPMPPCRPLRRCLMRRCSRAGDLSFFRPKIQKCSSYYYWEAVLSQQLPRAALARRLRPAAPRPAAARPHSLHHRNNVVVG